MSGAGALDYAAPQYYDGPDLADPAYITRSVDEWVALLGAGRVVVGFGVDRGAPNYSTTSQIVSTWSSVAARHPGIRGAFIWSVGTDEQNGWGYASRVAPLVRPQPQAVTVSMPVLAKGSGKATAVRTLQGLLAARRQGTTVNGSFDAATQKRVKAFQQATGLPVTGVVDAATWTRLMVP